MTEEQALAQATQEIEDSKPRYKNINNETIECNDEDYASLIEIRKNYLLNEYFNSYKESRQLAYKPITEQLDMIYWDGVNGTTNWADHIAEVKSNNPKPA